MGLLQITCIVMALVAFTGTSAYPSYNGLSALRFRELMADLTRGVRYDRNRYGGTTRTSQVSANSGSSCGTCANNHCCVKQGTQYTCKPYRMVGYSCTYDLNGAMAVSGTYYPGKTDCPCWTGLTCVAGMCSFL